MARRSGQTLSQFNPSTFKTCGMDTVTQPALFTFTSQPRPVNKAKYRNDIPRPRGAHDYYNVMWDPHVFRGMSAVPFGRGDACDSKCLEPHQKLSAHCSQKPKGVTTQPKHRSRNLTGKKLGGIHLPVTPPEFGRHSQFIQTEKFIEELYDRVQEQDICTQTDAIYETPIPELYIQAKFGLDVGTQVDPCEIFDFNTEVQPIIETMTCKIIEQALLEAMEEEELEALRDQQRAYEELRRQEHLRLQRLREREARYEEENRRLQCKLEEERLEEEEASKRVCSNLFAANYLRDLLPQTLDGLRQDGYLQNRGDLFADFVPWLNNAVAQEMNYNAVSRQLLDFTIKQVVIQRQREMLNALSYQNLSENQNSSQWKWEETEE